MQVDAAERFLVTGSDGCIGSWVVACLARQRVPVVAADLDGADRRVRALLSEDELAYATFHACDITQDGSVSTAIREHGVTRVVHLAALQVPMVAANPVRGADVNVAGTARVFEAVRRAPEQVRGLSYASSTAAHGPADRPDEPETLYGVFKRCDEEIARFYARDYDTPSVGLRPCVVYGPNRDQGLTAAITHAIRAAVLGVPYEIPFAGSLDLQFAEDVARSFIAAALAEPTGAATFDLHGESLEVSDVVREIEAVTGCGPGLLSVAPVSLPGGGGFDDTAFRELVGELATTPLRAAVEQTVAVLREQQARGLLTRETFAAQVAAGPSART